MKSFITSMLLLLALLLPAYATAYDFEVDGIYYNILNGNQAYVTFGTNKYTGDVTVPETVSHDGTTYSVAGIGVNAFYGCSGLTSVAIPNSVTSIGNSAFRDCTGLTSIDIPNSVTSIGWDAFRDCIGLTSINIPNSVTSIGEYAFDNTAWYDNQPDGLVYAGLVAYKYKGTMPDGTSIVLKEGTLGISGEAFAGCTGLKSIFIPNSVTSINNSAFWGCSGLMSIVVESGNPNYDSRSNCNAIIESASNTLIAGCKNTIIPNSVTSIGNYAFNGCSGLTSVAIPNSVTSIGNSAFRYCTGLTSINIPKSVTSISNYAFAYCSGLMIIVVESGNPNYDSRSNCNAIIETSSNTLIAGCKSTIIPNSVTSIGGWSFTGSTGLTSINIPNSVTSIGSSAFAGCSGLTSINIPNLVTSIGSYAFRGCTGLSVLYFDAKSCADFSSIPFENLNISTINIGDNVQRIPARLAAGLTKLLKIIIPNSVIEIGNNSFYRCTALTSVTIPNSVTSIGSVAFGECYGLTDVYCYIADLSRVSSEYYQAYWDLYNGDYSGRTLHVLQGMADAYRADVNWYPYFGQIVDDLKPDVPGDVNGDFEVNIADVNAVTDIILGGSGDSSAADVNGDGEINIADINALINIILGATGQACL